MSGDEPRSQEGTMWRGIGEHEGNVVDFDHAAVYEDGLMVFKWGGRVEEINTYSLCIRASSMSA